MAAGEQIVIDPPEELLGNVALDLTNGVNYKLLEHDYPAPDLDTSTASSVDTEGDPVLGNRYRNREITVKIRVWGVNQDACATALRPVEQKVDKVNREGGTYRRTLANGLVIYFDLQTATISETHDQAFQTHYRSDVTLKFTARPFGRGGRITLPLRSTMTGPVLTWVESDIKGDVPALGRVTFTNGNTTPAQKSLVWGVESRSMSEDASAALFFEAENLQDSVAVVKAGASNGNVVRKVGGLSTDGTNPTPILTLSLPGWVRFTHVGRYRVFARVCDPNNYNRIRLKLKWAPSTYGPMTLNDASGPLFGSGFQLADLGLIHVPRTPLGDHAWDGSVCAYSTTAGDTVEVDCLWLVPITEGYGNSTATTTDVLAANGGKLVVQHDSAWRNAGSAAPNKYLPPDKYEGDYLYVPPAGVENRKTRFIGKTSRAFAGNNWQDTNIDPLTAQVEYTPRYLITPSG